MVDEAAASGTLTELWGLKHKPFCLSDIHSLLYSQNVNKMDATLLMFGLVVCCSLQEG